MAIREYYCPNCNYESPEYWDFHNQQKETKVLCPKCNEKLEPKISRSGFILRGIGWAAEGYSKDIDDVEEFWARDGQPTMPHVKGSEHYIQNKKEELKKVISKNLRKT